ncbi:MAG: DUF692 family protein [Candidatus Marinimicrobia bacterium]|nr:DUF692 family protein [Candidatus Neomarinimicrobiota bacterium]
MIQLATPISHLFEDQENARAIAGVSDCLEVRERSLASTLPMQHLFHIDVDIVHEWGPERERYLKSAIESKPELKVVSLQATTCCDAPLLDDKMYELGGRVYTRDEMLRYAGENIRWLRTFVPEGTLIAVENNNYYPTAAYDIVTDGDFLTELIGQNDIYLLFDIAHAMVTAQNRGIAYSAYVDSLPIDRTVQIHICQPNLPDEGIAYDTHDSPNEQMTQDVKAIIDQSGKVRYLTIEYYKDKDILVESINNLRAQLADWGY